MKLHTLWKMWDDESLELLFALDEYTVEQNWQAWVDGCEAARARYKITEADTREAVITFNSGPVAASFDPAEVDGVAAPSSKRAPDA